MTPLFITGMFRSGTTLLARLLNTHPQISCASDIIRPLFNSFRYALADENYQSRNGWLSPLDDYFLSNTGLLRRILDADFDIPLAEEPDVLMDVITSRAVNFSGKWARMVPNPVVETYKEFIEHCLEWVAKAYPSTGDVVGCKEVWSTEFIPALKRSFPDAKFIVMVRDPRAVVASNVASGKKYPVFFLARQWRKLAWLIIEIKRRLDHWGEFTFIKYENLVSDIAPELSRILRSNPFQCACRLDVDPNLILSHISDMQDGDGNPWVRNSNHKDAHNTISTDSVDKWQQILSVNDIALIELICGDMMDHFGYEKVFDIPSVQFALKSRRSIDEMAEWIKPYSFDHDDDRFKEELLKEVMRYAYINENEDENAEAKWLLQTV